MIEAPIEEMNAVIERHAGVRELVDNGWIHLFHMDDDGRIDRRYVGGLEWASTDAALPETSAGPVTSGRRAAGPPGGRFIQWEIDREKMAHRRVCQY